MSYCCEDYKKLLEGTKKVQGTKKKTELSS